MHLDLSITNPRALAQPQTRLRNENTGIRSGQLSCDAPDFFLRYWKYPTHTTMENSDAAGAASPRPNSDGYATRLTIQDVGMRTRKVAVRLCIIEIMELPQAVK